MLLRFFSTYIPCRQLIAKDLDFTPAEEPAGSSRVHHDAYDATIEPPKDDVGYTGHKFDTDLGLSYMQARYYDPILGRFTSNDPIGFRDIHSFNRYAYGNNNPYKFVDPDGQSAKEKAATFMASAYLVAKGIATPAEARLIYASSNGEVGSDEDHEQYRKEYIAKQARKTEELAKKLHNLLDPIANTKRTTAVGVMPDGSLVMASSTKYMTKKQQEFAKQNNILYIKGNGHAEETLMNAGAVHVDASRDVCLECQNQMKRTNTTTNTSYSGKKSKKRRRR